MRQEQLYQGQPISNQAQGYSGNPILAAGSPKNINIQKGYQVQPHVLNAVFTSNASQLNPQVNSIKPLTAPIYASLQSPKNVYPVGTNFTVPSTPTMGAITSSLNLTGHNNLVQNMVDSNRSNPPVFGVRPPPTRPNFHFFGDDARQNAGKSISPPQQIHQSYQYVQERNNTPPIQVRQDSRHQISRNINSPTQIQNQNVNSQSRQLSPHSVNSNSSQKNKLIHRVRFFYNNPLAGGVETHVIHHQQGQQQVLQVGQPSQIGQHHPQIIYPNGPVINNQIVHMENNAIVTTTTIIWEHRFVEIYSKFQIFVEKFETVIEQIYNIDDLFDNVNDQEAWNDLRVRYTEMIQNFNIMREEIIMVLEQNKAAINSLSPEVVREISEKQHAEQQYHEGQPAHRNEEYEEENEGQHEEGGQTGKSGSENNNHVWENRCLELMQQHEMLTKQNNELKQEIERMKFHEQQSQAQVQNKQKKTKEGENESTKVAEMQKNLNLVHEEYERLEDNYNRLSMQYSRVVSELQNRNPNDMEGVHQELSEMEQQLEMAQSKINELYGQLQMKNQNIKQYEKEIQGYEQILEQNKSLMDTMNKMHHDLDAYQNEFKNKDKQIQEYHDQINKLHEQLAISSQNLSHQEQQSDNFVKIEDFNKKLKQIQALKQEKKNFINLIEKHEQSIQQMVIKNQHLDYDFQIKIKQKEGQIEMLQKFLQEERQAKNAALNQTYQNEERSPIENIADTKIFKERLQIEVEQITNQKNRKIRSITQDLEDLKLQVESLQKQKQRQIKQIKQYFVEEEEKYLKKITEKQTAIKILQEKTKSFESELSNRNLEISRFRHQSPINTFGSGNQQIKKHNQIIEKKNHEIQLLRRTIEQKGINIKELEQRVGSMEQQINGKLFEINSLKREVNDQNGSRAEIDNLNNIIKKKNQQLNQLRLSGVELQQLRINVDSLERQKIRLNEYLKQKTRQCESKDNSIQSLERKLNSISMSMEGYGVSRKLSADGPSSSALVNYENLVKQKENEIKNLNYEVEMLETKVSISQKTIRDLNAKVNNYQKSTSVLKADMENKLLRYETDIKGLNKEVKSLKDQKEQFKNLVQSLQSKNNSLQKSLDERNIVYDKQITRSKEKTVAVEQLNTVLLVDQELHKNQIDRLVKENKDLNEKIKNLENKIESKNLAIHEMKGNYNKKEKEDMRFYEEKIKKLDGELKISTLKLKNMEQQITNLNRKIELTESQKRSYRSRLINEQSQQKTSYFEFQQAMNSHFESVGNQEILEMDRFKLKDPEANDIFQRKVIYELKRENDILRKELSSVGPSSYSVNKYDNQVHHLSYQQQFFTDRDQETKQSQYNNQIISFYKNKNKEQESRIDELIKVNTDLKAKLSSSAVAGNQFSVQFYKDQVTKLENELAQLQAKMKKVISDHRSAMQESSGHQYEVQSLQDKVNQQNLTINELKKTINKLELTITQIENSKQISQAEIERLNEIIKKSKADKEEITKKENTISQMARKQKSLEQQISKLMNKINIQAAEIERLTEMNKSMKNDKDSRFSQSNEQTKRLKKRILELEREINLVQEQSRKDSETATNNAYKLEKIRSFLTEIDTLVEQIPTNERRAEEVIRQVKSGINEGLTIISMIQI